MNLKFLLLKSDYDGDIDDIYNDFYSKVLGVSSVYNRLGGFFSSETLALCAEGIQEFIKNNGHMRLILIPKFTKEDVQSIKDGLLTPEKYINREWIKEFEMISDKFRADHIKALGWMVANEYLEIRVALIKDKYGNLLDFKQIEKDKILNEQIGIFIDDDGNSISFRGLVDSLEKERLRIFKSWILGQEDYVNNDFDLFLKFWNLDSDKLFQDSGYFSDRIISTVPISRVIREKLINLAPSRREEIRLIKPPKLREYQTEAIDKFVSNNFKGIFEMATGTGKTITAIGCIKEIEKFRSFFIVVIVCPYTNLVLQWKDEVSKWGYSVLTTIEGSKKKWISKLSYKINDLNYNILREPIIIITTYDTFASEDFIQTILVSKLPLFLIADEVHASGSQQRKKGLIQNYSYRLGLSATPQRYLDDSGTQFLIEYFDRVVFELSLGNAIKQGFLCNYKYYPHFVGLTEEEILEYKKMTQKIVQALHNDLTSEIKKKQLLELYLFTRAKIVTNAKNKINKFKEIINTHDIVYSLVYCSENQLPNVQDILNMRLISNHKITSDIPRNPEERIKYLEMFELGLYDVIVAIRVLDEGLNIPAVKNAIILASTGNPKQFIQRRGRVLRKFHGTYKDGTKKEFANIFDILVIPDLNQMNSLDFYEIERSIVQKEISRYEEMSRLALNAQECLQQLNKIKKLYNL